MSHCHKEFWDNFDNILESIRNELDKAISDLHIPGLAFTLVSKDEILLLECLGHLEMEKVNNVKVDSLFCQPIDYFANLVENDPKHKFLTNWMVNSVVSLLKYLEQDEESEKLKEITKDLKSG